MEWFITTWLLTNNPPPRSTRLPSSASSSCLCNAKQSTEGVTGHHGQAWMSTDGLAAIGQTWHTRAGRHAASPQVGYGTPCTHRTVTMACPA